MLYHLLYPLHTSFIGFNVFRYITFRSIAAAVTAFLIMIIFGPLFIRTMRRFQIGQVVRDDGPASHLSKQGVPTMGGLLILAADYRFHPCSGSPGCQLCWLIMLVTIFFGSIGAFDDYRKISRKQRRSQRPWQTGSAVARGGRGRPVCRAASGLRWPAECSIPEEYQLGFRLVLHRFCNPAYSSGLPTPSILPTASIDWPPARPS